MNFKNPIRIQEIFSYMHEPEYVSRFVHIYWRALLAFAAVLVITFSLLGARQLMLLSELTQVVPSTINPIPPFDRGELQKALNSFNIRDARHEVLKKTPAKIVDPSR